MSSTVLRHRMPFCFGPSSGPRQAPDGGRFDLSEAVSTAASISFLTDAKALKALLPRSSKQWGDPFVTVTHTQLENLAWLAGRGYSLLSITFPVTYEGGGDPLNCHFMPVLWENMAEPILTGREELGFAKLYADLPVPDKGHYRALWDQHVFFEMTLTGMTAAEPKAPASLGAGVLHQRYMPAINPTESPAIDEMALTPAPKGTPKLLTYHEGSGSLTFHKARFEDMPTQFHIVNKLAELPILQVGRATIKKVRGVSDVSDQRSLSRSAS